LACRKTLLVWRLVPENLRSVKGHSYRRYGNERYRFFI
jgi:hypothetical protein